MIICEQEETVDELIKKLLMEIGRNDLLDQDEKELEFIYNAEKLNITEKRSKKVKEIFHYALFPQISYYPIHGLI